MAKHSEQPEDQEHIREKILGLGERSLHKTFFPALQHRLGELERFRALLDHSNEIILFLEVPSSRITDANEHARVVLSIAPNTEFIQLVDPGQREKLGQIFAQAAPGIQQTLELTLDTIPTEVTLSFNRFGESLYCVAVARDISDRLKTERILAASEEKYRTIFDATNDAVVIHTPDMGSIYDANQKASKLFGIPLDKLKQDTIKDVLSRSGDLKPPYSLQDAERWTALANQQGNAVFEWLFKFPNRGEVWTEVSLTTTKIMGEGRIIASIRDITDRKREEEALRRLEIEREKIRSLKETERLKDNFLSIISHELRTPLNAVMGFGSILDDEVVGSLNEQQHRLIMNMLESADRMLALVNNLLDYARMRAGKFQLAKGYIDYFSVVHHALEMLEPIADKKGIRFKTDILVPDKLFIDADKITQVFINLIDNAIKFSPKGSTILIRGRETETEFVAEVIDQGVGIPPEQLSKLFVPFQQLDMSLTRPAGGSGLGLSICKGIIEAHGGHIEAISDGFGKGTTFRFTIPVPENKIPA